MTFEEWKTNFMNNVTSDDIKIDWDAGHAYDFIECAAAENLAGFEDECEEFKIEFAYECGPTLYCVPWIPELSESYDRVPCECDCGNRSHLSLVEYTEEYLDIIKRQGERESDFIKKLQQWVLVKKLEIA